jgi:hypothetical protein
MISPLVTPVRAEEPWVPDPRLPHPFQAAPTFYYRTIHHQIFTLACVLCGGRKRARIHLVAEESDSPNWPK